MFTWYTNEQCDQFLYYGQSLHQILNKRDAKLHYEENILKHSVVLLIDDINIQKQSLYYYQVGNDLQKSSINTFQIKSDFDQFKILITSGSLSQNLNITEFDLLVELQEAQSDIFSQLPTLSLQNLKQLPILIEVAEMKLIFMPPDSDKNIPKIQQYLQEDQSMRSLVFFDKPFYCSSFQEICSINSQSLLAAYEQTLNSLKASLIVSSGTDFYERTYPKYGHTHIESEDPTEFVNPTFPIYVNQNGLKTIEEREKWNLSKQPWSSFMSLKSGYGIISISKYQIIYSQYSSQGQIIDEFAILYKQIREQSMLVPIAQFLVFGFLIWISFAVYQWITQLENKTKIIKSCLEGQEFSEQEDSFEEKEQNDDQSQVTEERQRLQQRDTVEETEMQDLSIRNLNSRQQNSTSPASSEDENEKSKSNKYK